MLIGHHRRTELLRGDFSGLEPLEMRWLMAADYAVIDLGTLGGAGSFALSVNQQLQVVGRSLTGLGPITERGFVWDAENEMRNLGVLAGFARSEATDINVAGDIVGTSLNETFDERAFRLPAPALSGDDLSDGEQLIDLGTLGGSWSRANAINAAGAIVGTSAVVAAQGQAENFHAFVWQGGQITDLGTLGGSTSLAKAINVDGVVVGLSQIDGDDAFNGFMWHSGVMTSLGTLGGPGSSASDINDAGVIAGDADLVRLDENGFNEFHAVVVQDGQITDLGTLGGKFSSSEAINDQGVVVGWSETKQTDFIGNRIEHAFVAGPGGRMIDLNDVINDPRWTLHRATAVNDEGYIVGYGIFDGGDAFPGSSLQTRAFMLRPLFADLAVEIDRIALADTIVPGDRGSFSVSVVNQGENDAIGHVTMELFASVDDTLGPEDVLLTRQSGMRARLEPGKARTLRSRIVLPPDLPPGQYHLIASVTPEAPILDSDPANNAAVTELTHEVVWMFGDLPSRRNVRLTVQDVFGDVFTFSMRGGGVGQVQSSGEGLDVAITNSTVRSAASVKSVVGDEQTGLHDITIETSFGKFDAGDIDLLGDFTATAAVREINFDDVDSQHLISIGADGLLREGVKLDFDQVFDLSINSAIRLDKLVMTSWANADGVADVISAPSIGDLMIKGDSRRNIAGDFDGHLAISGAGVGATQFAVGRIDIDGLVTGGHWLVAGHIGTVSAASVQAAWQGELLGRVKRFSVEQDLSGQLSAEGFDRLDVGRHLQDIELTLGPTNSRRGTLGQLNVGQWLRRAQVRSAGPIGSVTVGGSEQVNIFAGVRNDTDDLPVGVGDFSAIASIARFRVRGIRDAATSVSDTHLAAWTIGDINIARAGSMPLSIPPVSPIGIAAHAIRSLFYRSDSERVRLRRADEFLSVPSNEVMVRII